MKATPAINHRAVARVVVAVACLASSLLYNLGRAQAQDSSPLPLYSTSSMAIAVDSPNVIALGPANRIYAIDSLRSWAFLHSKFPRGATVIYDLERSSVTPAAEWRDPRLAEQTFVSRAHSRGYRATLAPSPSVIFYATSGCRMFRGENWWHAYLRCLASVPSDGFIAQIQDYQCSTAGWMGRLRQVIAWHGGRVIGEVSLMRTATSAGGACLAGDSGARLARDATAASSVARTAVWGSMVSSTAFRAPSDQLATLQDLLRILLSRARFTLR